MHFASSEVGGRVTDQAVFYPKYNRNVYFFPFLGLINIAEYFILLMVYQNLILNLFIWAFIVKMATILKILGILVGSVFTF